MKIQTHSVLTTFLLIPSYLLNAAVPDWENQAVFRVGTEAPRATSVPYADQEAAKSVDRSSTTFARSLNGNWKFHYTGHPDGRPTGFESPEFDDSGWDIIPVPANWQLHGYGIPLYSNHVYPFKVDPPMVMGEPNDSRFTNYPEDRRNPVGSYRKEFTVPDDWEGREVFVTFAGIDSVAYVWLNGTRLGYTQDSRTPAEFRLTPHLKPDRNILAVEVYQLSDGSYWEDQDMWRLSGIFRDVTLWSSAPVDIRDFETRARLRYAEGSLGELEVDLRIRNHTGAVQHPELSLTLYDAEGTVVASQTRTLGIETKGETLAETRIELEHVRAWSAEVPNLYTLLLSVNTGPGTSTDFYSARIGFRTVELKDGQLLVNGRPILFKGVNRHDHHPDTGHAMTREDIRQDLLVMKCLNLNAIRTSHYPNMPDLYELADELGFYVIDEANIEAHGLGWAENPLADDPAWYDSMQARVEAMVERDKNHPCIIIWSMGNEAGHGANFARLSDWIRGRDSTRLVLYERAEKRSYVDVYTKMYIHPDQLKAYAEDERLKPSSERRPGIPVEYEHAMGNSSGNFAEYWELFRSDPLLQGAFIWDFKDQGIRKTWETADGPVTGFAYGGDFGDYPNDGSFCINGLVMPDLTWSPQTHEVRKLLQNVWTHLESVEGTTVLLRVHNENFFKPIDDLVGRWILTRNGRKVAGGSLPGLQVPPQESTTVTLDLDEHWFSPEADYHLRVSYHLAADTPWSSAGTEIAWDQFALAYGHAADEPAAAPSGELEVVKESDGMRFNGDNFTAFIDDQGQLREYRWKGVPMMAGPLELDFWRAPTNNDRGRDFHESAAFWRDAGRKAVVRNSILEKDSGQASLGFNYIIGSNGSAARIDFIVNASGIIEVNMALTPDTADGEEIPRVGMQVELPGSFDQWTWYGRGPHENYVDRKKGAWVAEHTGTVKDLFFHYLDPQESGNRTDVRWARFDGENAAGLTFMAGSRLLEVSARPYSDADIEAANHPHELPAPERVIVNVDYGQTGLGGNNSWGAKPLEQYRLLTSRNYRYSFRIVPPGIL